MLTLKADPRTEKKKRTTAVRMAGFLPGVVYGPKTINEPVSVALKEFEKIYKSAGESTLVELSVGTKKVPVLIYDIARDPVTSKLIHADFYAVDLKKSIRAKVPVIFTGESLAIKEGAILLKVMKEIEVEALPENLPHEITISISSLAAIGDRFIVSSLTVPKGVKIKADQDDIIAIIEAPRAEEELVAPAPAEGVVEVKTEQEIKRATAEAKKKEEETTPAA